MEEFTMDFDISELKNIISDPERITSDIGEKYLTDSLRRLKGSASALVFPLSTAETAAVMRFASENGIPVTPRGAGTNLVGSTVPLKGGIILDFSRMNRILELDRETMTVTVEPGILLEDLQEFVGRNGLFYPPDPGEKASTIGGNISTNAGGMRAVKYGVTRDYVRGLEVVTADGKILELGGKCVKDASGLSLKNLVIGSEGTLAVITKAVLRVMPKPQTSLSVVVPFPDLKTGISCVTKILQADAAPTAVEFVERKVIALGEKFTGISYPRQDAASYILLTFDGNADAVNSGVETVRKTVSEIGALDYIVLDDSRRLSDIWKVRGCLVKAVESECEQEPVDIVVPINRIVEFINHVNRTEAESGVQMVAFGHAVDGNVHLCVLRGNRGRTIWEKELNSVMEKIYSEAYRLGGIASGEHGIGVTKRPYFLPNTAAENLEMMNRIKDALDPAHILNDGKSYIRQGR